MDPFVVPIESPRIVPKAHSPIPYEEPDSVLRTQNPYSITLIVTVKRNPIPY